MEKVEIPAAQLKPTKLTFHGIVPGLSCTPMGRIQLEVLFGEKDNFRREPIWFKVVDLNSPYPVFLGHSALAKFMAIPH
jgi:trimethylamine:corrinoid methyltransferase-like protein